MTSGNIESQQRAAQWRVMTYTTVERKLDEDSLVTAYSRSMCATLNRIFIRLLHNQSPRRQSSSDSWLHPLQPSMARLVRTAISLQVRIAMS